MKIAFIAPVLLGIKANSSRGGIDKIIRSLVLGAANAGHHVTLYAPHGTDLKHNNLEIRFTTDKELLRYPEKIGSAEEELFKRIVKDQSEFDLIHTHIEPIVAKTGSDNYYCMIKTPLVVTMHNLTYINESIDYYKNATDTHNINYVFISKDQSIPMEFLPKKTIIHNGTDVKEIAFCNSPIKGQLGFLGRITPEKGILESIQIAKFSGKKLVIAAGIIESQQQYYENIIKPLIDGDQIIYLGEVGKQIRDKLLQNSEALLFPIQWHEPFGLVMIEALASGTPVIANNIGSVSEIIEDGKTGFILEPSSSTSDYVDKINRINEINRQDCRDAVEKRFTNEIMLNNYLALYDKIIS